MNMVPVEGTEEERPAQLVLIAAGFLGSQKYVTDAFGTDLNPRTNVLTKPEEYETSVPGYSWQAICTEASLWWYSHCRGAKGSRGCGQVFDGQQFLRHKRTRQGGQIHATQS